MTSAIADESITVPDSPTWYELSSVGVSPGNINLNTDAALNGLAKPKAYQGTNFYILIDYKGNITIAAASDKPTDQTSSTSATVTGDSKYIQVYPTPQGRYADSKNAS